MGFSHNGLHNENKIKAEIFELALAKTVLATLYGENFFRFSLFAHVWFPMSGMVVILKSHRRGDGFMLIYNVYPDFS